jgi:hypothetical protein
MLEMPKGYDFFLELSYLTHAQYFLMNTKLLAIFAIVAALSSVGALAAGTIVVAQQASALVIIHHGCAFPSTGYTQSNGRCFQPGPP